MLAHDPADPAAERQAGDARVETMPDGDRQAKRLCLLVELARSTPACALAVRVSGSTRTPFIGRESIINPPSATAARELVSPALAPQPAARRAGEVDRRDHVGDAGAACDQRRMRSIEPFQILRCRRTTSGSWARRLRGRSLEFREGRFVDDYSFGYGHASKPCQSVPRQRRGRLKSGGVRLAVIGLLDLQRVTYCQGESLQAPPEAPCGFRAAQQAPLGIPRDTPGLGMHAQMHVAPRKRRSRHWS